MDLIPPGPITSVNWLNKSEHYEVTGTENSCIILVIVMAQLSIYADFTTEFGSVYRGNDGILMHIPFLILVLISPFASMEN